MRCNYWYAASLLVTMLIPAIDAHANPVWDFEYEADVLPTDANSIEIGGVPTTQFSSFLGVPGSQGAAGGEYNYSTLGTDGDFGVSSAFLDDASFTLNSDTGYTAEFRLKLNDVDTFGPTNSAIFEIDETRAGVDRYWTLRLFRTAEGQNQANLFNFEGGNVVVDVPAGFNTYRVTVLGTAVDLYVNNNLSPAGSISAGSFAANGFRFGDQTGTADADVTVDYLRLFSGGAVAPVPEPQSMMLLALGGLLLMRRRRVR